MLIANRGAEVGEKPQVFAQAQNRLLGAQGAIELVVFPVADCAKQHGIGLFGELQCAFWQRMAMRLISCAAHQSRLHFKLQIKRLEDFDRFGHDFCANTITGENCDFHDER